MRLRLGVIVGAITLCAAAGCSLLTDTSGLSCDPDDGCTDARAPDADAAVPPPDASTPGETDGPPDHPGPGDTGVRDGGDANVGVALPVPLAQWKLDDGTGSTALDSSGHGNAGALKNGTTWATGILGGALAFDGISQHVVVASSASLNSVGSAISLSAWVFRRAAQNAYRVILHRAIGTTYGDLLFLGFENNGFYAKVSTSSGAPTLTGGSPPTNTWIHLAFTYDGSFARLYVDRKHFASSAQTGTISADTTPITIGTGINNGTADPGEAINALVDDVRIYDVALTPEQIAAVASGK